MAASILKFVSNRESGENLLRQELAALLEALPAPVCIGHDSACHNITGNRAASEIFGVPVGTNISATPASGSPPPYKIFEQGRLVEPEHLPMQRAARLGETTRPEELAIHRGDGSIRFLYGNAVPLWNEAGKVRGCIGSFVDITERKQLELALGESEDRFLTMANSIPQLAWIAHADGFIFWYNQRWYEYTGTTPQQMEGWGWQSVHDPAMLPSVMLRWKNSIATGQPFDMEFPLRAADGQFRAFLTRVHPFKDSEGRVVQWFGTNTDIGDVALRTSELASANKELEAFAYSVSHDLRAPLRHLDGFAEMLRNSCYGQLGAAGQRYLDKITASAKKMDCLIDDLLAFSRLRRAEVFRTPVNLQQLLEEVRRDMEPDTAGRNLAWQIGELPEVFGDRSMLRQVFVNLLSNAFKYTRDRPEARIEIGSLPAASSNQTIVFVRDNGVGFEMKYVDKLFQVFQRLHSDKFEGTGVGLANVRRIVERHDGRVWAEGAVDKGATFYFSLDRAFS